MNQENSRKSKTHKRIAVFLIAFLVVVVVGFLVVTQAVYNRITGELHYLSREEQRWNPYSWGQILVFVSSENELDTVIIAEANKYFVDAIGAPKNQRVRVWGKRKVDKSQKFERFPLLLVAAGTNSDSSWIDFETQSKNGSFWGGTHLELFNLRSLEYTSVKTPFRPFRDVLVINELSGRELNDSDISTVYWSKGYGFVRFDHKNGTVWKLMDFIDP